MRHLLLLLFFPLGASAAEMPLQRIRLPEGFSISVFAEIPNARSMSLSDTGVLYVGNRAADKVWAVADNDGDGRADEVHLVAEGLNMPNGVAWHEGALYVAEGNRILRFDDIDQRLAEPPQPVVVVDDLPTERHHGWKFIGFGPDGKLYVPIGAPCNVCDEEGYALIMRMNPDGSEREVYAQGVRNTVGFDWDPATGELWFTDNGRDMLGDDLPDDELNRTAEPGTHFGFPYCHAGSVIDPQFGKGKRCEDYRAPALKLGAHVAALGMRFYDGEMFPERYSGGIFIAQHGSWNRSSKIGYRVVFVARDGEALTLETFAEGWLQDEKSLGRPVDVEVMPDGALLLSDDQAGVIYRIAHEQR